MIVFALRRRRNGYRVLMSGWWRRDVIVIFMVFMSRWWRRVVIFESVHCIDIASLHSCTQKIGVAAKDMVQNVTQATDRQ